MSDRVEASLGVEPPRVPRTSLLDEWIDEVGEDGVADVVAATIRGVEDGSMQSFNNAPDILADWAVRYPPR